MTNIEGDATVKRGNGGKHAGTESIRAHTHSSMPLMRIGILISQSRILFLLFLVRLQRRKATLRYSLQMLNRILGILEMRYRLPVRLH